MKKAVIAFLAGLIIQSSAVLGQTDGSFPLTHLALQNNRIIDSLLRDSKLQFIDTDFQAAYDNILFAIKLAEEIKNEKYLALGLIELGNFHFYSNADYALSKKYFQQALEVAQGLNDSNVVAKAYANIAKVSKKDESIQFYRLARKFYTAKADSIELAALYCNMGIYHFFKQNRKAGFEYYNRSRDIFLRHKDFLREIIINHNLAEEYLNDGDNAKFFYYSFYALNIAKEKNAKVEACNISKRLSDVFFNSGKFREAYEFLLLSYVYKDSVFNEQKLKELYRSKLNYEMSLKENQIRSLKSENRIRNTLTAVLLILFVAFVWAAVYYYKNEKYKRITLELLSSQKDKIYEQKQAALLRLKEIQSIRSNLQGQEKASLKIGNDLHDSVAAAIGAVNMQLSNLPDHFGNDLTAIKANLKNIYETVRNISHNLVASQLKPGTFSSLFYESFESLKKAGIYKIDADLYPEDAINALPIELKLHTYRIQQELLVNFLKHSRADSLHLNINLHSTYMNIIYEDNGIGFNPDTVLQKGIGMQNIKQRIDLLNGTWQIDSGSGLGTSIVINIPYNE